MRKYGRSQLEDVQAQIARLTGLITADRRYDEGATEMESAPAARRFHISEMHDLALPSLHRKPRLIPPTFDDQFEHYELGELEIHGTIDFTIERTGRNEYLPQLGSLIEVDLDGTIWKGYVECLNPIYFGIRPPQVRITLRPTGGPVFQKQPVTKEPTMKVFETIITTIDAQGTVTGIAQGVKLITALDAQAAKDATLVDYAVENKLTGKDLTGYKVRTREFLA